MRISSIIGTYKSPALSTGSTIHKWLLKVTCKINFNFKEAKKLEEFNFDDITSPLSYESYDGGSEIEIINSEIVDELPKHEIDKKSQYLREELKSKLIEVRDFLIKEFEFEIEEDEA